MILLDLGSCGYVGFELCRMSKKKEEEEEEKLLENLQSGNPDSRVPTPESTWDETSLTTKGLG